MGRVQEDPLRTAKAITTPRPEKQQGEEWVLDLERAAV